MPNVITTETLNSAYKTALEHTVIAQRGVEMVSDKIFKPKTTRQKREVVETLSGFGLPGIQNQGDAAPSDTRRFLYSGTVTPVKRALRYEVTEEAQFCDVYGDIAQNQPLVAKSMVAGRDVVCANVFNNGFTAGYTGLDGVTLFSTAHPTNGGPTYANTSGGVSYALSEAALRYALAQIKKQKDARGIVFGAGQTKFHLVVPSALYFDALVLAQSTQVPGGAYNDANVVKSMIEVLEMPMLTSDTAWFLVPVNKDEHFLEVLNQMPLTVKVFQDGANTGSMAVRTYESYTPYWLSGLGVWGEQGA